MGFLFHGHFEYWVCSLYGSVTVRQKHGYLLFTLFIDCLIVNKMIIKMIRSLCSVLHLNGTNSHILSAMLQILDCCILCIIFVTVHEKYEGVYSLFYAMPLTSAYIQII